MNYHTETGQSQFLSADFNISHLRKAALELFQRQYSDNSVYRSYARALNLKPDQVRDLHQIPFLPIRFFKSHEVQTGSFVPEAIFESSGTTGMVPSRHLVRSLADYEQSLLTCFRYFYGSPEDWVILALLPSYLERRNASLVYMADKLMQCSGRPENGYYLDQFDKLHQQLTILEQRGQKTILLGVTFALLDFAEAYPLSLRHTIVVETGGMKGRKREMTREEVHNQIRAAFGVDVVHAEYGMTELLSQAWSQGGGRFRCPAWMKILIREEDDPLDVGFAHEAERSGLINIIDLANRDSCAFLATDDLGSLFPDGSFEVTGRLDQSDLRGCSLLIQENTR